MKHSNNAFFWWCYIPESNHKLSTCEAFIRDAYVSEPDENETQNEQLIGLSKSYYNDMILNFYSNRLPGHLPPKIQRGIRYFIILSPTAGCPMNPKGFGPKFYRNQCISFEMITQDPIESRMWNKEMIGYIHFVELFTKYFKPIFMMGHRDYNNWWDEMPIKPPPETRVWPYNIYDLNYYPSELRERLLAFYDRNDDWTLKILENRTAILHKNDLTKFEHEVDPEITRAILGEEGNLLVPKMGYPAPQVNDP